MVVRKCRDAVGLWGEAGRQERPGVGQVRHAGGRWWPQCWLESIMYRYLECDCTIHVLLCTRYPPNSPPPARMTLDRLDQYEHHSVRALVPPWEIQTIDGTVQRGCSWPGPVLVLQQSLPSLAGPRPGPPGLALTEATLLAMLVSHWLTTRLLWSVSPSNAVA